MPAAIPIAAALVTAGTVGVAGGAGVGRNNTPPRTFDQTGGYDPNRFNYGGTAAGANEDAARYRGLASGAQYRDGAQANYDYAHQEYLRGLQARSGQDAAAQLTLNRALGQTPSIAQMQAAQDIAMLQQNAGRQMQQAQAAQAAQASSARGAAGVALAQQQAANNTANMQGTIGSTAAQATQNIASQAQINAAAERLQAEQAASGAYGQLRGADLATQQQMAGQEQFQAQLRQQQRGLNDAMTLGMYQNERGVRQDALSAGIQQQQMLAGSQQQQQSLRFQQQQANANNERALLGMALGGGMGAAQMTMAGGGGGGGGASGGGGAK